MPITNSTVACNTVAVVIASISGSLQDPTPVEVWNDDSTTTVYVGGSGVQVATGMPVLAQTSATYGLVGGDDLYAISSSAVTIRTMKGRQ